MRFDELYFDDNLFGWGVSEIAPGGIVSAEAFGTAKLGLYLLPTGIASAEAFGTAKLNLTLLLTGIASAEAFGTPLLFVILAGGDGLRLPTTRGQVSTPSKEVPL